MVRDGQINVEQERGEAFEGAPPTIGSNHCAFWSVLALRYVNGALLPIIEGRYHR